MFLKFLTFLIFGLAINFLFSLLLFFDVNKRVYNHRPGNCREIHGPHEGSEDLEIIKSKNIAFITSGVVYMPVKPVTCKGRIFKYDLSRREYLAEPMQIVNLDDPEFHPHGISHVKLDDGTIRLFVITHNDDFQHSVVILDYDEEQNLLRCVKTIRDKNFVRPNDIAAIGPNSFFISNDGGTQTKFWNILETFSGFYLGSVVYYDGTSSTNLLQKTCANGISLSDDQKTLFVSDSNSETIGVYQWDDSVRRLSQISLIPTLSACDNFHIDGHTLWTACFPVMKDAANHLDNVTDPRHVAPSQVLVAKFSDDYKTAEFVELLADDGRFISASSIAAGFDSNRQMLIGTVARKLYHCDIDVPFDF